MFPIFPLQDSWTWDMNHVLNVFNIYIINLLKFGWFGFSSPSARGVLLRKMMESYHPLNFSWYDSSWALFTLGKGWQKTNRTTPSSSSKAWFSCRGLYLFLWLGMNKGWLPTFKPLAGIFLDWNFAPFQHF